MDGLTSASIAKRFLIHLGYPNDKIIVLFHSGKQHGIDKEIYNQIPDNSFIWLPDADCSEKFAKMLLKRNCMAFDTNHHSLLPNEYSISINNQQSPLIQNKALAGVGTTFQFIKYYCQQINDNWYRNLLDMVMLGNISDVMSTKCYPYENRLINEWGIKHTNNPFLKYLYENLLSKDLILDDIVWNVSPLLNACCRSDNQELKQQLFECFSGDRDYSEYEDCLSNLKKEKSKQDYQVKKLVNEVNIIYNDKMIIAECEKSQYTGLIANKLLSKYKKNIILVHLDNDLYNGSVRATMDLKDIFNESGLFIFNAGHNKIFGTCFKAENLDKIKSFLSTLDIKDETVDEVVHSYQGNSIPKQLFGLADTLPNLWITDLNYPQFHLYNVRINTNNIQYLNKYKTTIKFTYNSVSYIRQFCSKVWREENHLNEPNKTLDIEVIGKLKLDSYDNPTVEISKIEIKPVELGWDDLF